jgi:hypothetical protein
MHAVYTLWTSSTQNMILAIKDMLESSLVQCGGQGCARRSQPNGSPLLHCARYVCKVDLAVLLALIIAVNFRCKTTVYVSLHFSECPSNDRSKLLSVGVNIRNWPGRPISLLVFLRCSNSLCIAIFRLNGGVKSSSSEAFKH